VLVDAGEQGAGVVVAAQLLLDKDAGDAVDDAAAGGGAGSAEGERDLVALAACQGGFAVAEDPVAVAAGEGEGAHPALALEVLREGEGGAPALVGQLV
jgi:hypothetical protein